MVSEFTECGTSANITLSPPNPAIASKQARGSYHYRSARRPPALVGGKSHLGHVIPEFRTANSLPVSGRITVASVFGTTPHFFIVQRVKRQLAV